MNFQITEIKFDFNCDILSDEEIEVIYNDHIGMIVEAKDEDDMIKEIQDTTGYRVTYIDYRHAHWEH